MLLRLLGELVSVPWRSYRASQARGLARAGLERHRAGDDEGARRRLEKALRLGGNAPQWWLALGDVRRRLGDLDKAALCYRAALDADPALAEAYVKLGGVHRASGSLDEAIGVLRRAYAIAPRDGEALRELVNALVERDACDRALEVAAAAAASDPGWFEAWLSLALAHLKRHAPHDALAALDSASRLRADAAELHDLRGAALQELGRVEDALAQYERAVALRPDFLQARFHRGLARLLLGDFERGWDDYELRRVDERRSLDIAEWDGRALAGRSLLVTREQGLGDEIMFASLLAEVLGMARRVFVECDPRLESLLRRSFPGATVFASLPEGALPFAVQRERIDLRVAAGSLPRFLRRGAGAFPPHQGYLRADPRRVDYWRGRLAGLGPGPKVGLSWTGGVRKTRRAVRSVPLERWGPILAARGVRFVSLQYTAGAAEEAAAAGVVHWPEAIDDLENMAALACTLDAVISVCTSLVHLCGALGRPAWVLAPYSPEWRYGLRGGGMVWYPGSVRLFRQPAYGDWDAPIAEVAAALGGLAR